MKLVEFIEVEQKRGTEIRSSIPVYCFSYHHARRIEGATYLNVPTIDSIVKVVSKFSARERGPSLPRGQNQSLKEPELRSVSRKGFKVRRALRKILLPMVVGSLVYISLN